MAVTEYKEGKAVLMDGTEISIRPLKLSLLKPFMKKFQGIADVAEDNEKSISLLLECVAIAMQQYNPDLADAAQLEELLDLPTVYKILETASGMDLTGLGSFMTTD
jgi:hypothetical protein